TGPIERRRWLARPGGKKIIRALPVELAAEYCTLVLQAIVERRAAKRTHRRELLARPAHRVVQPERLRGAIEQVLAVGVERREAADVDVPQVERSLAANDPFGDELAGAAGVGDARGVEPGAHEEPPQLRRLAEDEIAVEGE